MRVSSDPTNPAYLDDLPRRVWCNDREIAEWHTADEMRRCVITKDGKVHHGAVLIERLPEDAPEAPAPGPAAPVDAGFSGVFEPAATPAPTAAPAPAPTASHPAKAGHGKIHKRRR